MNSGERGGGLIDKVEILAIFQGLSLSLIRRRVPEEGCAWKGGRCCLDGSGWGLQGEGESQHLEGAKSEKGL